MDTNFGKAVTCRPIEGIGGGSSLCRMRAGPEVDGILLEGYREPLPSSGKIIETYTDHRIVPCLVCRNIIFGKFEKRKM
jgi:hypothetical protein